MFVGVPRVSLHVAFYHPMLAQMKLVVILLCPLPRKSDPDLIRIRCRVNGSYGNINIIPSRYNDHILHYLIKRQGV